MKIFSHTCTADNESTAKDWISGMGFTIVRTVYDLSNDDVVTILFYVPDKESETMLRLRYHQDMFRDMSA